MDGASDNVNYATYSVVGVLLLAGIFEEVEVCRLAVGFVKLPMNLLTFIVAFVRHTHNPVDGKFNGFSKHINGTVDLPGLSGGVQTLDQFDEIVKCAYNPDKFAVELFRFIGILNFKEFFHSCLDFSQYSSAKTNSKKAKAEGSRDLNILYFRFRLEDGVPRFRYKYYESDSDALLLPGQDKPSIKVHINTLINLPLQIFNDTGLKLARELATNPHLHPGYCEFKKWPMEKVAENIRESPSLTPDSKKWWKRFFKKHPKVATSPTCSLTERLQEVHDVPENRRFPWHLSLLKTMKEEALLKLREQGLVLPRERPLEMLEEPDPEDQDERIIHSGYIKSCDITSLVSWFLVIQEDSRRGCR